MTNKTALPTLYMKNFMEGLHILHQHSNPLTLQDIFYNKPSQHVKLNIKYSKSDKKQ